MPNEKPSWRVQGADGKWYEVPFAHGEFKVLSQWVFPMSRKKILGPDTKDQGRITVPQDILSGLKNDEWDEADVCMIVVQHGRYSEGKEELEKVLERSRVNLGTD